MTADTLLTALPDEAWRTFNCYTLSWKALRHPADGGTNFIDPAAMKGLVDLGRRQRPGIWTRYLRIRCIISVRCSDHHISACEPMLSMRGSRWIANWNRYVRRAFGCSRPVTSKIVCLLVLDWGVFYLGCNARCQVIRRKKSRRCIIYYRIAFNLFVFVRVMSVPVHWRRA
jgi:hypothetical protein